MIETSIEEIRPLLSLQFKFEFRETSLLYFYAILVHQVSNARILTQDTLIESPCKSRELSSEIFLEQIQQVILKKNKLKNHEESD